MIKLNEYEENLKDKKELVYHWLYTKEITYEEITNMYVSQIELEREYYKDTLAKSDVYVSTLIDNKKKEIDRLRPFAIQYMIDHKRLQGSKWYEDLVKEVLEEVEETREDDLIVKAEGNKIVIERK